MIASRYALAGDYPIRFQSKPPGAAHDYTIDFTAMLAAETPVTISAVVWSVVAIAGDSAPLTIVSQSFSNPLAVVRLSRGVPLETYSVRGQVSWSNGETSVVSLELPIASLPNAAVIFPSSIASVETFGIATVH